MELCEHDHYINSCPDCAAIRYRTDQVFLERVRSLMGTARMAREVAHQYAEDIKDPALRKQAQEELESECALRAALNAGIAVVLSNIRLGLTNDIAKEEAIVLFRVARCLLPQEVKRCGH